MESRNSERIRKRNKKIVLISVGAFIISIIIIIFILIAINEDITLDGDNGT
jgi:uncharacterized integral membrane protein